MENAVALVRALAWPVTVVLLVLLFRSELTKLMSRLSELKYRDVAAKFSDELDEAEESAASFDLLATKQPKPKPESEKTYGEISERVDQLASVSPRAAVLEAWRYLELATETAASTLGMKSRPHTAAIEVVRALVEQGMFNESALANYVRLRRMRNEAAHTKDFTLDATEARRYADLVLHMAYDLESASEVAAANPHAS